VEVHLIVEDCGERLSEQQVKRIARYSNCSKEKR
jgi:hypothetical protein